MKKYLFVTAVLLMLFSFVTLCYAGSVPEDLLSDGGSQVFFGEVREVEGDRITMIQRANVKGPFTQDLEVTYEKYGFLDSPVVPEVGQQYLCGNVDDNNPLYLWEVTGLDPGTLVIKNAGAETSMSRRMQEYLNDGKFEEKEQERLASAEASAVSSHEMVESTSAGDTEPEEQHEAAGLPGRGEGSAGPAETEGSVTEGSSVTAGGVWSSVRVVCGVIMIGAIVVILKKFKRR